MFLRPRLCFLDLGVVSETSVVLLRPRLSF